MTPAGILREREREREREIQAYVGDAYLHLGNPDALAALPVAVPVYCTRDVTVGDTGEEEGDGFGERDGDVRTGIIGICVVKYYAAAVIVSSLSRSGLLQLYSQISCTHILREVVRSQHYSSRKSIEHVLSYLLAI
jgi:hypothetical protein